MTGLLESRTAAARRGRFASAAGLSNEAHAPVATRRLRWRAAAACGFILVAIVTHGNDRRPSPAAQGVGLVGRPRVAPPSDFLRVATFNIHGGRDGQDQPALAGDAQSLAGVHLAGLNEVRGGWRGDQTGWLGERLGLAGLYAPSERRWWRDHWGNALLSAAPVGDWQRVPLPGSRGKGYRNYLTAEVSCLGTTLHVLLTHIDTRHDRQAQLQTVGEAFLRLPEPALLMGDLNSDANDPLIQRLLATPGVTDCLAEAAGGYKRRRIDWILARGLRTVRCGIREQHASDHPCFWADVAVAGGDSEAELATATASP